MMARARTQLVVGGFALCFILSLALSHAQDFGFRQVYYTLDDGTLVTSNGPQFRVAATSEADAEAGDLIVGPAAAADDEELTTTMGSSLLLEDLEEQIAVGSNAAPSSKMALAGMGRRLVAEDGGSTNSAPTYIEETTEQTEYGRVMVRQDAFSGGDAAPSGGAVAASGGYVELASGLRYADEDGALQDSAVEPETLEDGSVRFSKLPVLHTFAADCGQRVVLESHRRGGPSAHSALAGLSYYDLTSGQSALIAWVTNSTVTAYDEGVYYPNAFVGVDADILYKVHPWGIEQDVVIYGGLPDPAALGLDPGTTRLCALTELLDLDLAEAGITRVEDILPGVPAEAPLEVFVSDSNGWASVHDWQPGYAYPEDGALAMGGAALDGERHPVSMRIFEVAGRLFLSEEVPLMPATASVPSLLAQAGSPSVLRALVKVTKALPLAVPPERPPEVASLRAAPREHASGGAYVPRMGRRYVMDYVDLSGTVGDDITFGSGQTYFISSQLTLSGGKLTIEPGTVVKLAKSAKIYLQSGARVECRSHAGNPALFTFVGDTNGAGETIGSYIAVTSRYVTALEITSGTNLLQGLVIRHAALGVKFNSSGKQTLRDAQFSQVTRAVECLGGSATASLENVLIETATQGVLAASARVTLRDTTFMGVTNWAICTSGTVSTLTVKDTLFAQAGTAFASNAVVSNATFSGNATWLTTNGWAGASPVALSSSPFTGGGLGSFYLDQTCALIDAGTTNAGAVGLYHFTTSTNGVKESNTTVDIGFHYPTADDFDGDGLADFVEDKDGNGTYASNSADIAEWTNSDTDGDGLSDGAEYLTYGTSPKSGDTDGDGQGDAQEVAGGSDPLSTNSFLTVIAGTVLYSGGLTGPIRVVATAEPDLLAYYSFDQQETGKVTDLSGWNRTATNYNGASWVADGHSGGAYHLNGSNSWIGGVNLGLMPTGSVSMWLKSDVLDTWRHPFSSVYGGGDANLHFSLGPFGQFQASGSGISSSIDMTTNFQTGVWYHAVVTWTRTNFQAYLNGSWSGARAHAGVYPPGLNLKVTNIAMGNSYSPADPTRFWKGCIDEVKIYRREISASEVTSLYAQGVAGAIAYTATIASAGAYVVTNVPTQRKYSVTAFRDANGNSVVDTPESRGASASNPFWVGVNTTNINVTLSDPDSDGDGMPDWWESWYEYDPASGALADLAAWWRLDETSGTNALDATTNRNDAVVTAATPGWTEGRVNGGLRLDGSNDYAQAQDSGSLRPAQVSVAAWVKPDRTISNGSAIFVSKEQPGAPGGYNLRYMSGGFDFLVCTSNSYHSVSWPATLASGRWYHVVGTYDLTNQALYVDGSLVTSAPLAIVLGHTAAAPRLGATCDAYPINFFEGTLDDARIWNRGLASNEVAAIWEAFRDDDGDGYDNAIEGRDETNPTDTNSIPVRCVTGTISYSGSAPGTIYVITTTSSNGWSTLFGTTVMGPGAYASTNAAAFASVWVRAFRDVNGNGSNDFWEPWGECSGNPVVTTGALYGVNVTLTDPDSDGDGMPDWWERQYGFDNGTNDAAGDPDQDKVTNLAEYQGASNPNDRWSAPGEALMMHFSETNWNGTAGEVIDASGCTNNGMAVNGAAIVDSAFGRLGHFDGTNDYVSVSNSASLQAASNLTVSFWMRANDVGTTRMVAEKNRSGEWGLLQIAGGAMQLEQGSIMWSWTGIPANSLLARRWYHIVFTRDAGTREVSAYVNGSLVGRTNYPSGSSYEPAPTVRGLTIASGSAFANFGGDLKRVRVFNRVLATNEFSDEYDGDADGMVTLWEDNYDLCPTNASDASADSDTDGFSNVREYFGGSNPRDAASVPTMSAGYEFNEPGWTGTTGEVIDSSSFGNHGQAVNGAQVVSNEFGRLGWFDGTNDYITVPDSPSLEGAGNLTLSFWMRAADIQTTRMVMEKNRAGEWTIALLTGGLQLYQGSQVWGWTGVPSGSLLAGRWYHVVFTRDAVTRTLQAYLNGALTGQTTYPTNQTAAPLPTTRALTIGRGSAYTNFAGELKRVRVFNRVLATNEFAGEYDGDGDGMITLWEDNYGLDPTNDADVGVDSDADGFSNFQEYYSATSPRDAASKPGLIANYEFNETAWAGAAGEVADSSDCTNHGTAVNGAQVTSNEYGRVGEFDGTNDYIAVPDSPSLEGCGNLTLAFWMRPTDVNVSHMVIEKNRYGEWGVNVRNGALVFFQGAQPWVWNAVPDYTVFAKKWYHVVFTRDATTRDVRLYLNGTLAGSTNYPAGQATEPLTTSRALSIGSGRGSSGTGYTNFIGELDRVFIYNRVLSTNESAAEYDADGDGMIGLWERNFGLDPSNAADASVDADTDGFSNVQEYFGAANPLDASNTPLMVADYEFNEAAWTGATNEVIDSSSFTNHGRAIGGALVVTNAFGSVGVFDGTNAYVNVSDSTSLEGAGNLTVAFWMRATDVTAKRMVLEKSRFGEWAVNLQSGGLQFYQGPQSWLWNAVPSGNITKTNWFHIAITRDASTRTLRSYVNGAFKTQAVYAVGTAEPISTTRALTIASGKGSGGSGYTNYVGELDQVRVYDWALSTSDVACLADRIAPTLVGIPTNTTAECGSVPNPPSVTATDNVDPAVSVVLSTTSSGLCPRILTRVWTATDCNGNASSATQVVTVVDATAPAITCPGGLTISCDESISPTNTGQATAADSCDTNPIVAYSDSVELGLCEASRTITRLWTATDNCGNASLATQTVTVVDSMPPALTCPSNIVISCDESISPTNTGDATATDACDGSPAIAYADNVVWGACGAARTIYRAWTATDACGNGAACTQSITVVPCPIVASGAIAYTGSQDGTIRAIAVQSSAAWTSELAVALTASFDFALTNIPPCTSVWIRAFMDADGDWVRDYWEPWGDYPQNPIVSSTSVGGLNIALVDPDTDADGLLDWQELSIYESDPFSADTDGDGLVDGADSSVSIGDYASGVDADHDGYVDGEQDYGTNPLLVDTDGDGWDDGREASLGRNPVDVQPASGVNRLWLYHNSPSADSPTWELAPGVWQRFLMVDYETGTNTAYVIASPHLNLDPEGSAKIGLRVSFTNLPPASGFTTYFVDGPGAPMTSVVVSSERPFHGLPTQASVTLDVYRVDWPQPPLTDANIPIYYAPHVQTFEGAVVDDDACRMAYVAGWTATSTGGAGWAGAWTFETSSGDGSKNGRFIGSSIGNNDGGGNDNGDIDLEERSFGLYANSDQTSGATRALAQALDTNVALVVGFDNGYIETGGRVGMELQTSSGQTRFALSFLGGEQHYTIRDSRGDVDTGVPFTHGGLLVSFTLTNQDVYVVSVTQLNGSAAVAITGTLITVGSSIDRLRFYNDHAGGGPTHDLFFNKLSVGLTEAIYLTASGTHTNSWAENPQMTLCATPTGRDFAVQFDTPRLQNGDFEEGSPASHTTLPRWSWWGPNAGVSTAIYQGGGASGRSFYAAERDGLIFQNVAVYPGEELVLSGYFRYPSSADPIDTNTLIGERRGVAALEFYDQKHPAPMTVKQATISTSDAPDVWHYFAITSLVPNHTRSANVTVKLDRLGRGHVYFDSLNLVVSQDADRDAMPGWWEEAHQGDGLDSELPDDAVADPDHDGVINVVEYRNWADPRMPDSDGDLLPDAWELAHGMNPHDPYDAAIDVDRDGLSALEEYYEGTDPYDDDTDGDGLPDGLEANEALTNPLQADPVSFETVAEVAGADSVASVGQWVVEDQRIFSQSRRGSVEYAVTAPVDNMYRVVAQVASYPCCEATNRHEVLAYIDDEPLGRFALTTVLAQEGDLIFFTPWLPAGSHRIRLYWDNARSYRSFAINRMLLQRGIGPDDNQNGLADWVETRLRQQSHVDTNRLVSATSPACAEGVDPYLDMMEISGGLRPQRSVGRGWYANIPLSSSATTLVAFAFQNGGRIVTNSFIWSATDFLASPHLIVRRGDALRWTAGDASYQGGFAVSIIGVTNYSRSLPGSCPHAFNATGVFQAVGTYYPASGSPVTRTAVVSVVDAGFLSSPVVWVDQSRLWRVPAVSADIEMDWDERIIHEQTEESIESMRDVVAGICLSADGDQLHAGEAHRDVWTNVVGDAVADLTALAEFPNAPSYTDAVGALEGPSNTNAEYGVRLSAYLHPPRNGVYTFWISSSDQSELRLGAGAAEPDLIARVPGYTDPHDWGKYEEQVSGSVPLVRSNAYAIEVLHKVGSDGGNLAVAWQSEESETEYQLSVREPDTYYAVARLAGSGPILASVAIRGLRLSAGADADLSVISDNETGVDVVENTIVLSPFVRDVSLQLDILGEGIQFEDGSVVQYIGCADFNELGEAKVRFVRPAEAANAACHQVKVYQGMVEVGRRD